MPVSRALPSILIAGSPLLVTPAMTWAEIIGVRAPQASIAGRILLFTPGDYIADTKEKLPNTPLDIALGTGVRIVSTLAADGDPLTAPFAASENIVALPPTTTLAADAPAGSKTVSLNASFVVGAILRFNASGAARQFHAATRVVTAVAGGGPFTITLDEPIVETFLTGESATLISSVPTDLRIFGNGATMSGTGERFVEIAGGLRCYVEGISTDTVDGVPNGAQSILFSLDVGGRHCALVDLDIDGGGAALIGAGLESQNWSQIRNVTAKRASTYGIAVWDSYLSSVVDSSGNECTLQGIQIGADSNTTGCGQCSVVRSSGNASGKGITVLAGSTDTTIEDCAAEGNASEGLVIAGDATTVAGTRVLGGSFKKNDIGIHVDSGGDGTKLVAPDVTGNATQGIFGAADFDGYAIESRGGAATNEVAIAAGRATLHKLRIRGTTNFINTVLVAAGARCAMLDADIECPAGANGVAVTGGVLDAKGGRISGAANGITVVGGIARIQDVDTAGSGPAGPPTGVAVSGGGQLSFGVMVLNGAVPVVVPFGDIRNTDTVSLERQILAGVAGAWTVTIQPGASFTVTGTAVDTSTLAYRIE